MTDEQQAALRAPFPPELIGKKSGGGRRPDADFVGHGAVTDRLLAIDAAWTWEPAAWDGGEPAFVRDAQGAPVALWGHLTVCGVTRPGVGTVSGEVQSGEPEKELIGDFLRNAAMRFGVALDLWIRGKGEGGEGGRETQVQRAPQQDWFVENGWNDQEQHDVFMAHLKRLHQSLPPAYRDQATAAWKERWGSWPLSQKMADEWDSYLEGLREAVGVAAVNA